MQYASKFLRMLLRRNLANNAAKLRIRKGKDFNITEFFLIRFVFLWNKACRFIRIYYLCPLKHRNILIRNNDEYRIS